MQSPARPAPRLFSLAVATASMATVALELVLTRIYSVTMYYHFAFLAISVALLGLAAAGTAISLLPRVFTAERTAKLACLFMLGFAGGAVWSLGAAISNPISLKDWTANAAGLAHIYAAAAAPLLCSGFAISLAISRAGPDIGRIYMFDLVGAGVGCVLLVPAIGALGAPGALLLMAALGAMAALLFALSARGTWPRFSLGVAAAGVLAAALLFLSITEGGARRFGLVRNPAKFLGNRAVLFEKWNSFSQITVAPAGDGDHRWLFIDGDAATRMWDAATKANPEPPRRIPEVRVASLVYALRPQGPAAIIGPGGGTDVLSALRAGVSKVVGIEINPIIVEDVMRDRFAEWNGGLYNDPRIEVVVDEGRSYLRRSGQQFSSIQATLVDTWAASSSGAFTLSENNIYTVEAFGEFFAALAPGGALSVTRWYDPRSPAEFVRLLAIARAALEERGVSAADLHRHFLIATDGELRATLMVSSAPFSDGDVTTFVDEALMGNIRVLYQPGLAPAPDAMIAKVLTAPTLDDALAGLHYDASPTTDNKPFFFYHLRLGDLTSAFHRNAVGQLNNVGVMLLVLMLGFSVVTTLVFVIAPLLVFRRRELAGDGKKKARLLATFACLGLGFILVELGFMQQFVLFLGHPVYALAVVLATVLIASGLGAGLSGRLSARLGEHRAQRAITLVLAALLFVYGLGLSPLFGALIGLPLPMRIAIAALLVAAPGLLMGTYVPASVRAANAMGPGMVAWCWGINGATSVVGSVAAVMISMNAGFTAALFTGVVIYLCAGALLPRPSPESSTE